MNTPTYPPGPWVRAVTVHGETGVHHAAIFTRKSLNDHGAHFPLMVFDGDGTPSDAVANLVAAAPDLHSAAVIALDKLLLLPGQVDVAVAALRAAIAKAEGRS